MLRITGKVSKVPGPAVQQGRVAISQNDAATNNEVLS